MASDLMIQKLTDAGMIGAPAPTANALGQPSSPAEATTRHVPAAFAPDVSPPPVAKIKAEVAGSAVIAPPKPPPAVLLIAAKKATVPKANDPRQTVPKAPQRPVPPPPPAPILEAVVTPEAKRFKPPPAVLIAAAEELRAAEAKAVKAKANSKADAGGTTTKARELTADSGAASEL